VPLWQLRPNCGDARCCGTFLTISEIYQALAGEHGDTGSLLRGHLASVATFTLQPVGLQRKNQVGVAGFRRREDGKAQRDQGPTG
jgi:hypothetical protein